MYIYEYTKKAIVFRWLIAIYGLILLAMGVYGLINEQINPCALIFGPLVVLLPLYMILFSTSMTVRVTSTEIQIICGSVTQRRTFLWKKF